MKRQKGFLFSLLFFASTLVQAAEYEEVSYDDLVNQLNKRKTSVQRGSNDPLDDIQLHAGFGLITSANNVNTGGGRDTLKYQNGFQMSLGIDLFSPSWTSELALRNFGQAKSGTETRSLREFDLKFMNRNHLSEGAGYRIGAGIGNRYLKIDDEYNDVSIDDSTPIAVFFGGLDAFVSKNLSLGIETGIRTSMINSTADRSALDLTIRLDTYF
ncbi:MAG: hypothetical protein ACAH59_04945 [Pseudobdellovibrionaceae bacterium]